MSWKEQTTARIRAMPVRQKLRVTFILTTAVALLLAGLGILVADSVLFYQYLERDLASFVEILGSNSASALAFDDAKVGRDALASLRARPHVVTACLYHNDGTQLALYTRSGYDGTCPPASGESIVRKNDSLVASHVVRDPGRRVVGSIVLVYDLMEIGERLRLYGLVVVVALLLASVFAWRFSSSMRATIAEPLLELASTANSVSRSDDYGIRAAKLSDDEVGAVVDAFNHMLKGIQSRDEDLHEALNVQREQTQRLAHVNSELNDSNQELARSNQDLERFAFVASHDLQEPLRMITTYTQLLVARQAPNGDNRSSQYVDYIVSGTRRMRELLSDLLAYTEIAGVSEQPVEPVDLNAIVAKVLETLSPRIAETHAVIRTAVLPTLEGHEGRLTSLFMNLVSNALKYRSERPLEVRISVEESDGEFTFSVADNGIGIAGEYHHRIFDAFKRLHGKDIPGSGIGLAICQRIVERYGGRIWVESEAGSGATFRFTLPKSLAASKV